MAYDSTSGAVDLTVSAAADLSAKQYHIVKLTADNTVNLCTAVDDVPLGVLQNKPGAAGRAAVVRIAGISKLEAGAALSAGAIVATSTGAKAQAAVSTQHVLGQLIDGAGSGEIATAAVSCLAPSIKA